MGIYDIMQSQYTGAWMIHVVLIALGIVLLETVPGITQDLTWTIANLGYLFVSSSETHPFAQISLSLLKKLG